MMYQIKHRNYFSTRMITPMVIGLALLASQSPAAAQVSYHYTGNVFNQFSCGPSDSSGTLNCSTAGPNENTSYSLTDKVTATMSFDSALLPNLDLADVRSLPGFQLSLSDGQQTVTGPVGFALISTNGSGAITAWRLIINLGNAANGGISTQNWFNTATVTQAMSDMGTLACCHPDVAGDFGAVRNNPGTWNSGAPTPQELVTSLIAVVESMNIPQQGKSLANQLQQVSADIAAGNGQACADLQGFANHVRAQTGKKITLGQAQQLIEAASAIGAALGCSQ